MTTDLLVVPTLDTGLAVMPVGARAYFVTFADSRGHD